MKRKGIVEYDLDTSTTVYCQEQSETFLKYLKFVLLLNGNKSC